MDDGATVGPAEVRASSERPMREPVVAVYSMFVPGLLIVVALVGWLGFQCAQQSLERQQLGVLAQNLDAQEAAAKKVRASLESVATATAKLAGEGNPNARAIVEELRKRGVTINAPKAP